MAINPDMFLEDDDIAPMHRILRHFAEEVDRGSTRRAAFNNANISTEFIYGIHFDETPPMLATEIFGWFRNFRVSDKQPNYHPMISFLKYLSASMRLDNDDELLCKRLLVRGQENLKVIAARSSVGRIESPEGHYIGTGVLVGNRVILTCDHVLNVSRGRYWIRFGYKMDRRDMPSKGESIELEVGFVAHNANLDFALIRLKDETERLPALPFKKVLDCGQEVHLIHHPQGRPVEVSDAKRIVDVGDDYISHTISASNGSSGAPIFDMDWRMVAIHRGNPRELELTPGTNAGIPVIAFWDIIAPHLSLHEN